MFTTLFYFLHYGFLFLNVNVYRIFNIDCFSLYGNHLLFGY
jgi:hypothetical protein